jgi:hypothetical protein
MECFFDVAVHLSSLHDSRSAPSTCTWQSHLCRPTQPAWERVFGRGGTTSLDRSFSLATPSPTPFFVVGGTDGGGTAVGGTASGGTAVGGAKAGQHHDPSFNVGGIEL